MVTCIQWNMTQPWEWIKHCHWRRCEWTLRSSCWAKSARQNELKTPWYHLRVGCSSYNERLLRASHHQTQKRDEHAPSTVKARPRHALKSMLGSLRTPLWRTLPLWPHASPALADYTSAGCTRQSVLDNTDASKVTKRLLPKFTRWALGGKTPPRSEYVTMPNLCRLHSRQTNTSCNLFPFYSKPTRWRLTYKQTPRQSVSGNHLCSF